MNLAMNMSYKLQESALWKILLNNQEHMSRTTRIYRINRYSFPDPLPPPHSQLVGYNPCICHIAKHIMGRVSYFMTVDH